MGTGYGKLLLILVCCTAYAAVHQVCAFARGGLHHGGPDSPHHTTNGIVCTSCHDMDSTDPKLIPVDPDEGSDIDDTRYNSLCLSCHNPSWGAPVVKTHSSLNTTDRYGNWTVECWVCHSQHKQEEVGIATVERDGACVANSAALIYSGVTDTVNADTITVAGAGWPVDGLVGLRVAPDIGQDPYCHWNYRIVSNTETELTVEGPIDLDEDGGGIDTGIVAGRNFGIFLGKLMPEYIDLAWITDPLEPRPGELKYPRLFNREGANSYADGDEIYDGICEVCHTMTKHFQNDGTSEDQEHTNLSEPVAGTNCIRCHTHANGFAHGGGPGTGCVACHGHDAGSSYDADMTYPNDGLDGTSSGNGTVQSHSTHTETVGDDLKGPGIYCDGCHNINSFPYFKSGTDSNGDGRYSLSETDVCDDCHSRGGTYDGVDDPVIGAKQIWNSGAYAATDDSTLGGGKEKWCAGCHDEAASVIAGVTAPNVIGDEDGPYAYGSGWGYYETGHGLARGIYPASGAPGANQPCSGCHDYSTVHIDGAHRTFLAASDNYQSGYRLKYGMDIPRTDDGQPVSDFALCFSCHDSELYITSTNLTTNFREGVTRNSHYLHLQAPPTGQFSGSGWWDSDWDGAAGDSKFSCPACHNVHGSPLPRMMRHGELISSPGTADKVPALNFKYTPAGSYPTLTASTGGVLDPPAAGGGTIVNTGVCSMCHSNQEDYTRTPGDMYLPEIIGVYGKADSNILSVLFSEGVYTDPGASGALAATDFAYTDADNGRAVTGVTHAEGGDFALLTLSAPLDATNDIDVDTLAAATASSIYDAASQPMETDQVVVTGDTSPPVLAGRNPANGATEIAVNSNLNFTLSDSGAGIDWSTFRIELSGSMGYARTYTDLDSAVVAKTGDIASYSVTVNPDLNFSNDELLTVTVDVSDYIGNALVPPAWSFTTQVVSTPQTMTIHPSGLAAEGSGNFVPTGGDWADVLDSNDGDVTYVSVCCQGFGTFYVDMDDPDLGGGTVNAVTAKAVVKNDPGPYNVDLGYKTGASTIWLGNTSVGATYTTLTLAAPTDSDGGVWSLTDLNNLRVAVWRNYTGSPRCYVTEVAVEINYTP